MSFGIDIDGTALLSIVLEGILYGVSLLMFIGTILVLIQEKYHSKSNMKMIWIAVALMTLATAHMIVNSIRIDEDLIGSTNYPGGSSAFFTDISNNTFVIKNVIYTCQTLVGDGMVIYRCYIVWQSIRIIIIPLILWCGVAVAGFLPFSCLSQNLVGDPGRPLCQSFWYTGLFFSSTLVTNLLSAGLLAYRIWTIERGVAAFRPPGQSTMMPVLHILVDAALLYSATLFTALVCFASANNGMYVVADMAMPIISISFYMVLVRIALRRETVPDRYDAGRGVATAINFRPTDHAKSELIPPYPLGN